MLRYGGYVEERHLHAARSPVSPAILLRQITPANSASAKTKRFVIVTACTEASLRRVLTFTHFIIMLIILSEPIIMYWMDPLPTREIN